ncbi:MAG: PA0069 family radical SAM protein [Pseudomonadota bacterium]|nr:PA0069 family radical SAM protein [Pseudomonadota bacterium]
MRAAASRPNDASQRVVVARQLGAKFADGLAPAQARRGRGAPSNATSRFDALRRESLDDGWGHDAAEPLQTEVAFERPRTIITRNESPDISFDRSINPYRGCEHGCSYCFARPTHAYHGLSAGLDFETKLFVKENAAALLEKELAAPKYRPAVIALGANTDAYQPIERQYRVTRAVLEVLARTDHPVGIVTKSNLVVRDLDLLAPMAAKGLAKVYVSVTTLDRDLARRMEPRAPTPERRLEAIAQLAEAGVPVGVLAAPIVPAINDDEIEKILARAYAAGAREAGYVTLRLPLELRDLFREWLAVHFPDKLKHTLSLVQSMHGGKDYESQWGRRMAGSGPYAWMIGRRFEIAARKLGFREKAYGLRSDLFKPPVTQPEAPRQLSLF